MNTIESLQEVGMVTTLYSWEQELADRVGTGRTSENKGKGDRLSYDPARLMADNLLANVHAASAEIGVARIIGAYCYAGVWPKHMHKEYADVLPDVMWCKTEVEVKWRRTGGWLPVDLKDVLRNRLVLWAECKLASTYECICETCTEQTYAETRVRLIGGGFAADLWSQGKPYKPEDTQRVGVPASALMTAPEILALQVGTESTKSRPHE